MRLCPIFFCTAIISAACVTSVAQAQQPPAPAQDEKQQAADGNAALKELFEAKIKAEWDALKNKDRKTYGDLLADEYQGVETDGQGERNKLQAIAEVSATNVANYTLWGLKVTPLDPNATFVVYEVTIQFPPGSALHFSRLYIGALWIKQGGAWKELHYQETHVK